VIGREQIFRARRHPLDRPAEPPREPGDQDLLAVGTALHAEAAAHVGRDHAYAGLVEPEHPRDRRPDPERRLRRRPHRELAGVGIPAREGAPRLHRHAAEPLLLDGQAHAVRRLAKRAVRVAVAPRNGERAVVAALRHDLRGARRQGAVGVGHTRKRLVLDREPIGAVDRRVRRLGDDRRHRHALRTDDIGREQRIVGNHRARRQTHERHRPDRAEIARNDDRDEARYLSSGAGVDRADARVRVGATRQDHVQGAGDLQIVDEASATGDQRPVLPAFHRSSDPSVGLGRVSHVIHLSGDSRRARAGYRRDRGSRGSRGRPSRSAHDRARRAR